MACRGGEGMTMRSAIVLKLLNYTCLSVLLGGCVSLQETDLNNQLVFSVPMQRDQNFQLTELPSPKIINNVEIPKLIKLTYFHENENFIATKAEYVSELGAHQDNDWPLPNLNLVLQLSNFGIIQAEEESNSEYLSRYVQKTPAVIEIAYQLPTPLFVKNTNINNQDVSLTQVIRKVEFLDKKDELEISAEPISLENNRSISVEVNERFELLFEGEGWIYLGDFSTNKPGDIKFSDRSVTSGKTKFQFFALNNGQYQLEFQLQNFRTGVDMKEIVYLDAFISNVRIVSKDSNDTGLADTKDSQKDYQQLINITDKLLENGLIEEALSSYLLVYEEGDFDINQKIAKSYFSLGKLEKAAEYWQRNIELSLTSENQDELVMMDARLNLLNVALIKEDISEVKRLHPVLLSDFKIDIKNRAHLYFEVGNFLFAKGYVREALDIFLRFVDLFQHSKLLPEVYFQLANAFESPSIYSDLIASRKYYQQVIIEYPFSNFVKQSTKRIKYLDQYFFKVR